MKHLFLALFTVFLGFALSVPDAEARRMGGARNSGMQRDTPMKREAAPQQGQTPPAGAPAGPAQTPKRSWMGPIAGLAAGLGLAALFSHLGLGEEMANVLMLALLALGVFLLVRWFLRRAQPAAPSTRYAAAGNAGQPLRFEAPQAMPGSVSALEPQVAGLPPGFDAEAFVRQAKVNFLRMQAANDAGNLDDLREFTTPEMYAELKLDIDDRRGAAQRTEVTLLNAEVLEAVEEGNRYIVSVRFHGLMREDNEDALPFDETWHLVKPAQGGKGWLVAGIQQNG